MATTTERLISASAQNKAILEVLFETNHVTAALRQNQEHIASIHSNLAMQEAQVQKLDVLLQKGKAEHEKYRDSAMLRFAYKLGGKKEALADRVSKEEKQYLEAVDAHSAAMLQLHNLRQQLTDAIGTGLELESSKHRHDMAQKELDDLYDSIFGGVTPEFPEEDRHELPVTIIKTEMNDMQSKFSTQVQVLNMLTEAKGWMGRAQGDVHNAAAKMSAGGSRIAKIIAARKLMDSGVASISQVQMLVDQARHLQPLLGNLGEIFPPSRDDDDKKQSFFTKLSFEEVVLETKARLRKADLVLDSEIKKQTDRLAGFEKELHEVGGRMAGLRAELQRVRTQIFEQVAGGLVPEYKS